MIHLLFAIQVNLLLAVIAKMFRVVDVSGMIAGVLIGVAIWQWAGASGYVPFAAFVVGGAVVTKVRLLREHTNGACPNAGARARGASRSASHAIAYCLSPSIFAALWQAFPDPSLCHVAVVAGLAWALADVASTELAFLRAKPLPVVGCQLSVLSDQRPLPSAGSWQLAVGGVHALAASALVGAAGWLLGGGFVSAIDFSHLWIVMSAAAIGYLAKAAISHLMASPGRFDVGILNLCISMAACLAGFALAYLSR